jgi:hypothetical protein
MAILLPSDKRLLLTRKCLNRNTDTSNRKADTVKRAKLVVLAG